MAHPVDRDFFALQEALAGRYSLERELGRGGMGIVYLAREVALDRLVAIKLLPPGLATQADRRDRFLREARTAARLSHPNIIPIFAVDEVGDFVFFAMGYVEGETLGERVRRRGPLPPNEAARVLRECAWALAYAHAQGVIHRDVKPDNILLETSGRVLIGDFGIARLAETSGVTTSGEIVGTAEFMSPEQANGAPLDATSDLYSLGAVGFYALSGRLPFEAPTAAALLAQHVTKPAPPVSSVAPALPRRLAGAIDRCLAKDPAHRFPSGEALAEEVAATLEARREIPVAVRVFLKKTVDADLGAPGIAIAFVAAGVVPSLVWGVWHGSSEAQFALGTVSMGLIAVPSVVLIARLRRLIKAGHPFEDLSYALKAELVRRREEAAFEYGRKAGLFERATRVAGLGGIGTAIAAGGAMAAFGAGDALGLAAWVGAVGGVGAALLSFGRFHRRRNLKGELWSRFWHSRLGRWLFSVAGVGVRRAAVPASATHRPTELAIGTAVGALFDALPKEVKRALRDLPDVVRRLETDAQLARQRMEEMGRLGAEVAPGARGPAGAAVAERRDVVRSDLGAVRDLAEQRLGEAVAALETIRLDLLRLHAGTGSVQSLTADLAQAREVGEQIGHLLDGRSEVEALLRPGPPAG